MKERWQAIIGYEGLYEISTHGKIKRLERAFIRETAGRKPSFIILPEKILTGTEDGEGYIHFVLTDRNGKRKLWKLHSLMVKNFIQEDFYRPRNTSR